ncbi:TPA: FhaB protein, partial [Vibrio parahaemolyticus]
ANIDVETEKSIYNSFGGKVLGKNVTLYSKSGAVINGSLIDKVVYLDDVLTIGGEGYEVKKQFGIWHELQEKIKEDKNTKTRIANANSASTVSASILADNLTIQARRIENINPYRLKKSNSVNWDAGIRVNGIKANQVAIEAERSLKLKASGYVLNSSAIMGLNGGGEFLVNSPIFSNERYEISFESYPYRVVEYSQDDSKKNEIGHYTSGTETKILTYSPPGRVFSFGDFQFSRGGTSDPKKVQSSKLFNEVSYFQAFKDARFFNSTIKSIGLEIGTDTENTDFEGITSCLNYRGCNREYVTTRTEAETLLSFEGNLFGVNGEVATESDLVIDNINSLEIDKKNIILNIVNNYISINKAKIDEHPNNILVRYLNSMYSTFTYEYRLSNVEVVSDVVKGEVLVYVAYTSKPSNWPKGQPWSEDYKDLTKWEYSQPYKFSVNWKEIYDEQLGDKELGDTGFTQRQIDVGVLNFAKYEFDPYEVLSNCPTWRVSKLNIEISNSKGWLNNINNEVNLTANRLFTWTANRFHGDIDLPCSLNSPLDEKMKLSKFKNYIPHEILNDDQIYSYGKITLNNDEINRAASNIMSSRTGSNIRSSYLSYKRSKGKFVIRYRNYDGQIHEVTLSKAELAHYL